jgi:arginase family enzyme
MRHAVALLGRTSERDETAAGAHELGELLGAKMVGDVQPPRSALWDADLRDAGPALAAAQTAIEDGADLLLSGHCSPAIATLPAVVARHPGVRIVWIDAHPDFNTPATSPSGFLGGMPLAAACGLWDAGFPGTVDPTRVHLLGARDVDPGERELIAAHGVRDDPPTGGPVYVHLDLDVLRNDLMPAAFPAPGGWSWEDLRATLTALPELVGLEVAGCSPGHARRVADTLAGL